MSKEFEASALLMAQEIEDAEARDAETRAELERLRATVARVEALEPFVFKGRPGMPAVVSYHALCTALGVALALDGDASEGKE